MDDPEPSTSPKSSSTPRECEHLHSRIFPVCTLLPHVITHRRPDFFFLWPCSLIPSNCISPACALIHWAACREADSQLHVSCVAYKYFSLALALLHTQPLFWCTFLIMHSPSNLISVAERLTQLWRRLSCHATVWLNHMFLCSCCPRHVSALKHLQEVRDTATSSVRLQFRWNVLETPLITSHHVCLLPSLCLPRLLPPPPPIARLCSGLSVLLQQNLLPGLYKVDMLSSGVVNVQDDAASVRQALALVLSLYRYSTDMQADQLAICHLKVTKRPTGYVGCMV